MDVGAVLAVLALGRRIGDERAVATGRLERTRRGDGNVGVVPAVPAIKIGIGDERAVATGRLLRTGRWWIDRRTIPTRVACRTVVIDVYIAAVIAVLAIG